MSFQEIVDGFVLIASFVAILDYFGIKPKKPALGVKMTLNRKARLVIMLTLVGISLGLSGSSFYRSRHPKIVEKIIEKPIDRVVDRVVTQPCQQPKEPNKKKMVKKAGGPLAMRQDCGGGNCAQSQGQQGGITTGQLNINAEPPLPHVGWKITSGSGSDAITVEMQVDAPFSNPSFRALCDSPCESVSGGISVGGAMFQVQHGWDTTNPNVAILHFNMPSLIAPNTPMHWTIKSKTASPLNVVSIEAIRF